MDVRVSLRRLVRSRVFAATAILVLGLGLGINLILFNTAYALLWRPLNFPQPDRLVTIGGQSRSGDTTKVVTGLDAWTARQQTSEVTAVGLTGRRRLVSLLQGDEVIDLASAQADSGYFRVLGLRPVAGRLFNEDDDLGGWPERPALLRESFWRSHFHSDRSVVGRVFLLQEGQGRAPVRIAGIVTSGSTLPFAPDAEILLPLASANPSVRENGGDAFYRAVIRLRPGISVARASARVGAALHNTAPDWGHYWLEPLRSAVAPASRTTVILLYTSACLLLLLTAANLASLFAARSMTRSHETAVHLALGATRWRVFAADFQESLLVCAAGTILAFLLEGWMRPLAPRFLPALKDSGPELLSTGPVLLGFGMLMGLAVSAVVSAASGLRFRYDALSTVLAQGGRSGSAAGTWKLRTALASAQLAIVLTLLTASGMVGRSFLAATHVSPGLRPEGVVTFQVSLPGSQRAAVPAIAGLADQVAAMPRVERVAFAAETPVGSPAFSTVTAARSGELLPTDPMVAYRLIGPGYFETVGAHLVEGRAFTAGEVTAWSPVAVLNECAARLLFRGVSPLHRTIHSGIGDRHSEVVGVVQDIRTEGLDQAPVPMVYLPYFPQFGLRFIVRTAMPPDAFLPLLRTRMRGAGAGILVQRFRPLSAILDDTVRERRVSGLLIGAFAVLGLLISSVGLYGTLASRVQQRRREIGVRIALGANVRQTAEAVLGEGARIFLPGSLAGLAASVAAGRLIQRELFGVAPLDPVSFASALVLLAVAAGAACAIPALKAARIDPIQVLNAQ